MKISLLGLMAATSCLILCAIFLYANPYASSDVNNGTIGIMYAMLIIPAMVGVVASLFNYRIVMIIVFIWSLPYGLYITVASIPSIWNLFGVVLMLYVLSAVQMKRMAMTS